MDFNNYFEQNQQGNRELVKKLGEELERVTHFKYLGASMGAEGGMETEITNRVGAGWRNCKKCCGVLCDRRMPVKLKGKVYKTVIKPEMLYGAETWATTKVVIMWWMTSPYSAMLKDRDYDVTPHIILILSLTLTQNARGVGERLRGVVWIWVIVGEECEVKMVGEVARG